MSWQDNLQAFIRESADLLQRTRLSDSPKLAEKPAAPDEPSAPVEAALVYEPLSDDAASADELAVFQALMAINNGLARSARRATSTCRISERPPDGS